MVSPLRLPEGVLHLRLDRPEKRNALDGPLIERLLRAIEAVSATGPARVLLLSGDGPAFCAGADLEWMLSGGRAPWEENLAGARRLAALFAALDACPLPTVARVHGAAYGGAIGLVAAVDVAVAAADTRFALSEVRLGLVPAVVAPYVLARIGEGHLRALATTGETFGAERARQLGLVHAVAGPEGLDEAVGRVLADLTAGAPGSAVEVRRLLRGLRRAHSRDSLHPGGMSDVTAFTTETLARLRAAPVGQEGLLAALERRPPAWAPPPVPATREESGERG